jgi:hypothetical protein
VSKLNSAGSALVYSTFLGGLGDDAALSLVVDAAGTAYVSGVTSSPDFPTTANAAQRRFAGYIVLPFEIDHNIGDGFVARLNAAGSALLYSTYLGGATNDAATAIAVDPSGIIYVAGNTDSIDFPVTANALQKTFAGRGGEAPATPLGDAFLAVIDQNSSKLVYSSFYGGTLDDIFGAILLDPGGNVWLTGNTVSKNLPVSTGAAQASYGGRRQSDGPMGDAMLVKFDYQRCQQRNRSGFSGADLRGLWK